MKNEYRAKRACKGKEKKKREMLNGSARAQPRGNVSVATPPSRPSQMDGFSVGGMLGA